MNRTYRSFGALVLLTLAACEGSSGKKVGDDGPLPYEYHPAAIAGILCGPLYRCCTSTQRAEFGDIVGNTEAECRARVTFVLSETLLDVQASISGGRLAYDGAALARCLDASETVACPALEQSGGPLASCDFLLPKVGVGGACLSSAECIDGFCTGDPSAPNGNCQAGAALGAACTDDVECVSSFCGTTGTCINPPPGFCS